MHLWQVAALPEERLPFEGGAAELFERSHALAARTRPESREWGAGRTDFLFAQHDKFNGELVRARETLEHGLAEHAAARDVVPWLWMSLAEVDWALGRWELVEPHLAACESALEEGNPQHAGVLPRVFGIRGQIDQLSGLPDRAAVWFAREREAALASGDPTARLTAVRHELDFLLTAELDDVLLERAEAAGELVLAQDRHALQVYLGVAQANLARAGRFDAEVAASTLRAAISDPRVPAADKIRPELVLARLELQRGDHAAAAALLDSARARMGDSDLRDTRAWHAMLASRLSRARGDELGPRRQSFERLSGALRSYLDRVRSSPSKPGGTGFLDPNHCRDLLVEVLVAAEDALGPDEGLRAGFELLMEAQSLGSLARSLEVEAPDLAEVRRAAVPAGGGVLVFLPAPTESLVLAFDSERFARVGLPPYHALRADLASFTRWVSEPPAGLDPRDAKLRTDELAATGARLSAALFPAAVRELMRSWSSVTLVGAEYLGDPPLEALPLEGQRLGERWATSHTPSLPTLVALRGARDSEGPPRPVELALIAAPLPSAQVAERWPLVAAAPLRPGDIARLTAAYGARARVLSGADATEGACNALAARGAVLQVVAHGVFDPERERGAALVLASDAADDGVLTCAEAERWQVPDLVVLSACGAAFGPARVGDDGIAHLGGAFLKAGARSVVLSRHSIASAATIELMAYFHTELRRAGCSPAEALRRARLALAKDPGWNDPFYTGLVFALGDAHVPVFPMGPSGEGGEERRGTEAGPSPPAWTIAAALAALIVAAWLTAAAGTRSRRRPRTGSRSEP